MIHIPFVYVKKIWDSFKLMLNYKQRYDDQKALKEMELKLKARELELLHDKQQGYKYCSLCGSRMYQTKDAYDRVYRCTKPEHFSYTVFE